MASKYDSIKTPKDLLVEVAMHGLSTNQDDICRAQDIFGNASVDELVELANDNGRRNDKGEPDMFGSWSSGKDGTQKHFYSVLFHIWNWEDATRFYNQHSNPEAIRQKEDIKEANVEIKDLKKKISDLEELVRSTTDSLLKSRDETIKANDLRISVEVEKKLAEDKTEQLGQEIIALKAKLYDLMTAEEES